MLLLLQYLSAELFSYRNEVCITRLLERGCPLCPRMFLIFIRMYTNFNFLTYFTNSLFSLYLHNYTLTHISY